MVDFHSRYKLYNYRASATTPLQPTDSYRELYRESTPSLFSPSRARPLVHDCREPIVQDFTDKHDFDALVLSRSLKDTNASVLQLHEKDKPDVNNKLGRPNKLLYGVGQKGSGREDLFWPRGLSISLETCDLFIADSGNHRIKIYNNHGILRKVYGKKGRGEGEFNYPCGTAIMPDDKLVVADSKNKRIQVFSILNGAGYFQINFKYQFPTIGEPYNVTCNHNYDTIVSTLSRTIEVYRKGGKLLHRFYVEGSGNEQGGPPLFICTNDREEIIVSDGSRGKILFYKLSGELLYSFRPEAAQEGLSVIPAGVCVNPIGQVIVVDSLNHTLNQYSERGKLLRQLAAPQDGLGASQTCGIGPEGHLVVTEYSCNGPHMLKILRYRECECHAFRPSSSKTSTRKASPGPRVVLASNTK